MYKKSIRQSYLFSKKQKGFTIVELLVGMAILGVLLAISLVAVNPLEQFAKTRNTKRRADVEALANAVNQYRTENNGNFPPGVTTTLRPISSSGVNLCTVLVTKYLSALPQDPNSNKGAKIPSSSCSNYNTGYSIISTGNGHYVVNAPSAELGKTISETR